MAEIHPTAIVEEGAELASDVVVEAYARVGGQVRLGANTRVRQGAIVEGRTSLGSGNTVFPYACVGTIPQDKKYAGENALLEIGNDNKIREFVTINIGTNHGGGLTSIGDDNLFMAYSHVGHDCRIGSDNVIANSCALAGHIVLHDHIVLGGMTGIHQFVHVGSHVIASAGSLIGKDVLPYTICQGDRATLRGINLVGLKRRGFSKEAIAAIKKAYRLYFSVDSSEDPVAYVRSEMDPVLPEVEHMLAFAIGGGSGRALLRPQRRRRSDGESGAS